MVHLSTFLGLSQTTVGFPSFPLIHAYSQTNRVNGAFLQGLKCAKRVLLFEGATLRPSLPFVSDLRQGGRKLTWV